MEAERVYADDLVWLGTWRNVAIEIYGNDVKLPQLKQATASTNRLGAKYPDGIYTVSILKPDRIPRFGAEERAWVKDWQAKAKVLPKACAQVMIVQGLLGSAVRAILTGVNLFNRNEVKVFSAVTDGCIWLGQRGTFPGDELGQAVTSVLSTR
jgi:hypothetical protein